MQQSRHAEGRSFSRSRKAQWLLVRRYEERSDQEGSTCSNRSTGFWRPLFALALFFLLGSGFITEGAFAQERGTITGEVVTENRSNPLPGANIVLEGEEIDGTRGAVTTARGQYTFSQVPEGEYTVRASYIGYTSGSQEVTVEDGETVTVDFALSTQTVRGEEVVVLGSRAQGQAKAFSQQKTASNVQNVVAADQMGRFPDASAPAALQRVPGINVTRDQGEARYVQMRGGSADMTQVSFNGSSLPSPEGEARQVALDMVPVELLGQIEVNKAITPDMEAEGTGGAVNLVTKRPPSEPTLNLEAGGGLNTIRNTGTAKFSGTYGNRFGNVGVLLSGSVNHRRFGSDGLEAEYSLSENPSEDQLAQMEQRIHDLTRRRSGATAFLDYAFGPNSRIFFNGVFSSIYDNEFMSNPISIPEDNAIEYEIAPRVETSRTFNFSGGGEHLLESGVNINYKAGWAHSEEDTPTENTMVLVKEGVSFNPNPDGPVANPSSIDGEYAFSELESEEKHINNTDVFAQLDVGIPYTWGDASGTFKFGGKIKNKNADQSVEIFAHEVADGTEDIMIEEFGSPLNVDGYVPGNYSFPSQTVSRSTINNFADTYSSQLASEKDLEGDTEDYDILERVTAGYVMTEMSVTDRLLILPGVRFEHTTLESDGNSFDAGTGELTPVSEDNTYSDLFPMLHLRYALGENTNLRAAVTRTLERPNYFFSVPYSIRDEGEVERGNPELDPMTSVNYDLILRHYSDVVGVLSAGAFAKQLANPIYTSSIIQDNGVQVLQPRNASSGRILGLELNVQRQLPFFPSPFDGLSVYANYTYTSSEQTLQSGRTTRLPGQSDRNWNFALGYEKYGFSARVSLNYSGDYIEELGDNQFSTFYVDSHFQVDASASYQFTSHISTSLELVNLNNEPFVRYQGRPSRKAQQEYYRWWGRLSVNYDL